MVKSWRRRDSKVHEHAVISSFSIVINCAKINVSLIKSNGLAENPVLYT